MGGGKSPGDGTGRGGRPVETQTTVLGQKALNQCPTPAPALLDLNFTLWTRPAPPPLTLGGHSVTWGPS